MFFGALKMFSGFETIFSKAQIMVEIPETISSAIENLNPTIKTMMFLFDTTVCVTKTLFSEA